MQRHFERNVSYLEVSGSDRLGTFRRKARLLSLTQGIRIHKGNKLSIDNFPAGQEIVVSYPNFQVRLTFLSVEKLKFEIEEGPFARTETVDIEVISLGNSTFAVSWQEKGGAAVANIQDYDRGLVHSFAMLPGGQFLRMTGTVTVIRPSNRAADDRPKHNKALVLEAMTALFQRHEASAVDRLYAPNYIQHNPRIPQGRDALRAIVANLAPDVYYEPGLIVAEAEFVAVHGRIRGWANAPQVVVDLFRIEGGKLAEHWDVLQDDVPKTAAVGGVSIFDPNESAL
jgi:predicted SnoaL-like aldol condensation-catalyzing enzyme